MDRQQQAAAHDANFLAAIRLMAELAPGGVVDSFGPLTVAITGLPGAFFNATWVLEPVDAATLDGAVQRLRSTGLPFVVHVRSDLPDVEAVASATGLTDEGALPCFAIEPGPIPSALADLEIRRVTANDWDPFVEVTAAGFGMPRELVDKLYAPSMLDRPDVRAYLGHVSGQPVATSMSVRTGSTLGVYSVATIPDARGHGYGTALTWELLRDAEPGWDVAVLQASEMGRPIYERMGFQLVREFRELIGRPPA
jgi:GNAT superfamily N-acetyltransferase